MRPQDNWAFLPGGLLLFRLIGACPHNDRVPSEATGQDLIYKHFLSVCNIFTTGPILKVITGLSPKSEYKKYFRESWEFIPE